MEILTASKWVHNRFISPELEIEDVGAIWAADHRKLEILRPSEGITVPAICNIREDQKVKTKRTHRDVKSWSWGLPSHMRNKKPNFDLGAGTWKMAVGIDAMPWIAQYAVKFDIQVAKSGSSEYCTGHYARNGPQTVGNSEAQFLACAGFLFHRCIGSWDTEDTVKLYSNPARRHYWYFRCFFPLNRQRS